MWAAPPSEIRLGGTSTWKLMSGSQPACEKWTLSLAVQEKLKINVGGWDRALHRGAVDSQPFRLLEMAR